MTEPAPAVDVPENGSYAMVAQACAMAIQDAVAHLRNTETICVAVTGLAQDMMMRSGNPEPFAAVIASAQASVAAAAKNLEAVSAAASKILQDFPRD
jgi:hypothetical protein